MDAQKALELFDDHETSYEGGDPDEATYARQRATMAAQVACAFALERIAAALERIAATQEETHS